MAPATASKVVSKKRKLESTADASSAVAEGPLQEAPKGQLHGHSQCVSGVVWPDQESIYSGSWDHSVSPRKMHDILRHTADFRWLPYVPYVLPTSSHCIHSKILGFPIVIQVTNAWQEGYSRRFRYMSMPRSQLQQKPSRLHSGPCCNQLRLKRLYNIGSSACGCQVRRWDADTMVNTDTHNSSKAIYCVAAAAKSAAVVAFGGADRAWRLWDRRQSRKEDMVKLLPGYPITALYY